MTDNIIWSTLENAISMGGRRATLRKPSVSLPHLRLGHITGGYTLGLTPRPSGHSPIGERRISPKRQAKGQY